MVGGGPRVSIPANTRKMIQSIKEITAGNYSEDEIHAMLHECNMDPDDTAQRLLLQDPFHEVKKKRDKRKENLSNKDSAETPWRSGGPGRGSRGGRGNFSSRHTSLDAGGSKNSFRKENGPKQATDPSISISQEIKIKEAALVSSLPAELDKGSAGPTSGSSAAYQPSNVPSDSGQLKVTGSSIPSKNLNGAPASVDLSKTRVAFGSKDVFTEQKSADSLPLPRPSSSEVRFASSDPKQVSEQTAHEPHTGENKFPTKSRGVGKTATNDTYVSRPVSSHSNSTGSRPSSNYSNRSHQTVGPQRGTSSVKEWKPKTVNATQGSGASSATEAPAVPTEASDKGITVGNVPSAEAASRLQKQLEDLHIQQRQHVIIPNHILVPEAQRTKLSFGSFDAGFSIASSSVACPENEKSSTPPSQNSQEDEESFEGEAISQQNAPLMAKEEDNNVNSESLSQVPDDLAGEDVTTTGATAEYEVSKQETTLESESNQNSYDHVPSNMIGFVPPPLGSHLPQFENADPQSRDALRIPNFVMQQPFDTASYYAQFYRPGPESDGRVSPFVSPGVATKFNGNVTILPHSSQSPQEGGNNLVLSTASPTPLVTQAAGLMQSSMPVAQQPVPVFRPPPGLHMSHYPPNYMPYGHYFSPFYLPPQAMHQFLNNGAFAQQPQASGVYPPQPPGAAAGGKYSLPHYKPGTNTGSLAHVGMPGGYGPYGSFPAGYNPSTAASAGNSNVNEDLSSLQLKESNGYSAAQQSEPLPVWVAGPGRDVPTLPANSFYGLQHHGQHVTYTPAQAAHVTFPGMYHPGQPVTAPGVHPLLQQSQGVAGPEMVAPAPNVFQQPQQTQMNWPSNY